MKKASNPPPNVPNKPTPPPPPPPPPKRLMDEDIDFSIFKRIKEVFMSNEDTTYEKGHKSAVLSMLQHCLSELCYQGSEAEYSKWIIERERTINILRGVCEIHGDNDWDDNLYIPDIIEKHLGRHLET